MNKDLELLIIGTIPARVERISKKLENQPGYRFQVCGSLAELQGIEHATLFGRILASSLTEIYTFDAETLLYIRANRGAKKISVTACRNCTR